MSFLKIESVLVFIALLCFSCKKNRANFEERLTESGVTWHVQTYAIYSNNISSYNNKIDAGVLAYYEDVGDFVFQDDYSGYYTYENLINSFEWNLDLEHDQIEFDIPVAVDDNYNSPFIYCYFAGNRSTPFLNLPENRINEYKIKFLNNYTIQVRFSSNSSSNFDNFRSLEFILTKKN